MFLITSDIEIEPKCERLAVFDIPIATFRIFEPISSSTCTVVSEGTEKKRDKRWCGCYRVIAFLLV